MAAGANGNAGNAADGKASGGGSGKVSGNGVRTTRLQPALNHNPGLSLDWTQEEQSTLEELLAKYAPDTLMVRYAKIAKALRDKTVRDVALRCRWMDKKENSKRRKDDHNSSRKNKDKKENAADSLPKSSQAANRSNGPSHNQSVESEGGVSYTAIDGAARQLLEQSAQALDQISANFSDSKIHGNIELFCQARKNILSILNDCNSDVPEVMKQMPQLPDLNEELADAILPRTHK